MMVRLDRELCACSGDVALDMDAALTVPLRISSRQVRTTVLRLPCAQAVVLTPSLHHTRRAAGVQAHRGGARARPGLGRSCSAPAHRICTVNVAPPFLCVLSRARTLLTCHVHMRPLVVRRYKLLRDFVEGRCVGAVGVDCCVCVRCHSLVGCAVVPESRRRLFFAGVAAVFLLSTACWPLLTPPCASPWGVAEDVKWADMHAVVALCLGFRTDPATGAVTQQVCV